MAHEAGDLYCLIIPGRTGYIRLKALRIPVIMYKKTAIVFVTIAVSCGQEAWIFLLNDFGEPALPV